MNSMETEQNNPESGLKAIHWTHNPGAIVIEELDYMLLYTLTNIQH